MRPGSFRKALLAVLISFIPTGVLMASPFSPAFLYELSRRSFSEIHSELSSGYYDYLSPVEIAGTLLNSAGAFSPGERDALLAVLIRRTDGVVDRERELTGFLLLNFGQLSDPALRAQLMQAGHRLEVASVEAAIHQSAGDLAERFLSNTEVPQGYDIEAFTAATLAPAYPSLVLAENLRTVAAFSRTTQVADRARDAARQVISRIDSRR